MNTLQEHLNQRYPTQKDKKQAKEIIIDEDNPLKEIVGGKLDLSEYPNLEKVII